MHNARTWLSSLFLIVVPALLGQGPQLAYLADPDTSLSWAECYVHLNGGSRHKIPFLPVVSGRGAPLGTEKYNKDISVDAYIAFVGNGIVSGDYTAYGKLDVAGKVVMFSYDFPDSVHADLNKQVSLLDRVREAASRKAAGVVVFSMARDFPFPFIEEGDPAKVPEIPVIAVNRRTAAMILASAGRDPEALFEEWKSKGAFQPEIFISKLVLRIQGKFDHVATPNFDFYFQKGTIPSVQQTELAGVNEKSVDFILNLFKEGKFTWHKSTAVYFSDYDSKLFYLHHWGRGLSSDAGTFMVFDGVPDFGLAAHENAHKLLGENWNGTSSFLQEGLGKYAEAMASDKDKNHRDTAGFLKDAKLFRLTEMVTIHIGSDPRTPVAYPAAGSFVQYLTQTFGLSKLKVAWQIEGREKPEEDPWTRAFGMPLPQLESDWLHWLGAHYGLERKTVEDYLATGQEPCRNLAEQMIVASRTLAIRF